MAIELRQQLRLSQQLVMTPQLQQAIKLLQLNRLELTNLIEQELQENPVLEEVEGDEQTPAELADETPGEGSTVEGEGETRADAEMTAEQASEAAQESAAESEPPPSDAEKIAEIEWDNYMYAYPQTGLEPQGGG